MMSAEARQGDTKRGSSQLEQLKEFSKLETAFLDGVGRNVERFARWLVEESTGKSYRRLRVQSLGEANEPQGMKNLAARAGVQLPVDMKAYPQNRELRFVVRKKGWLLGSRPVLYVVAKSFAGEQALQGSRPDAPVEGTAMVGYMTELGKKLPADAPCVITMFAPEGWGQSAVSCQVAGHNVKVAFLCSRARKSTNAGLWFDVANSDYGWYTWLALTPMSLERRKAWCTEKLGALPSLEWVDERARLAEVVGELELPEDAAVKLVEETLADETCFRRGRSEDGDVVVVRKAMNPLVEPARDMEALKAALFPRKESLPQDVKEELAKAEDNKLGFMGALEENLETAIRQPFPDVNRPYRLWLLPWDPRIRKLTWADLTSKLTNRLRRYAGVRSDVSWPRYWKDTYARLNAFKVCRIHGFGMKADVVVAFVSCLRFETDRPPALGAPDAWTIDMVSSIYRDWKSEQRGGKVVFTFFALGSPVEPGNGFNGVSAGDHWVVCSSPGENGASQISAPPRPADRLSLRNFMDRLKPETRQQRISRVKSVVDKLLREFQGNIVVGTIKKQTDYSPAVIRDALFAVQEQESEVYRLHRIESGLMAIDKRVKAPGPRITRATFRRGWLGRYLASVLLPLLWVCITVARDLVLGRAFDPWWLVAMIPSAYVGMLLDKLRRRFSEGRE